MVEGRDLGMHESAPEQRRAAYLWLALGLVGLWGASGCSASAYAVRSSQAARSVEHARHAQAGDYATYEFTLAEAYLAKSREESSAAAYQDAIALAKKSKENADKALEVTKQAHAGGR